MGLLSKVNSVFRGGNADEPVAREEDDALGMNNYAEGLADFLSYCDTPLTVGIQGEWGSGKTSLMNMIKEKLEGREAGENRPPFLCHTFETWQFGSLAGDETLGLQLLQNLTSEVLGELEEGEYISKAGERIKSNLAKAMRLGTGAALNMTVGSNVADQAVNAMSDGAGANGTTVKEIKQDFADLVAEASGKLSEETDSDQPGRIVIFVDDLDRIRPSRAVAMLEILKNFMEVEHCVFVLACDYEVIRRGVRDKFDIEEEEKARAFFDKIIQVPFQMPVEQYELDDLLRGFLETRINSIGNIRKTTADDWAMELSEELAPLVQLATGTNPRSFKRYLNILDLLTCVEGARQEGSPPWTKRDKIFCRTLLVAMQVGWEEVVNYLDTCESAPEFEHCLSTLRNLDGVSDTEGLTGQEDEELLKILATVYAPDDGDASWVSNPAVQRLGKFGRGLFNLLDRKQNNRLDEDELETFMTVTEELSLTAVDQGQNLTGWHKFRHSIRENASGDRWERIGTARQFRELAHELYQLRSSSVVSVGRHGNRFVIKVQFDSRRKLIELNDRLHLKIRDGKNKQDIPAGYTERVEQLTQKTSQEPGVEWSESTSRGVTYKVLDFDDVAPSDKTHDALSSGVIRLVEDAIKFAERQ